MGETIITLDWFKKLNNALVTFCGPKNSSVIKNQLQTVHNNLITLQNARTRCSNYTETQNLEDNVALSLRTLADSLGENYYE